ncbi:helix-turn-helix transcriptional regulator [Novosphingobium nitrogenifigens]|nr:LuxR family transcriptional regulator [Novosphingobium nitrogenifigens]
MVKLDDRLIATLYSAVDNDSRWVDLLDGMRAEFEVESAVVQVLDNSAPDLRMVWESRDRISQSRVALHDSWANTLANPRFRRPRQRITDVQISSDQRLSDYTAQDRSVLREGLARCRLGLAFWISVRLDPARHFTMIFHRAPEDGRDIGPQDLARLEGLAPHLQQALRLWVRLDQAEARVRLIEDAADGPLAAMIACDRRMRVQWMNADARRILHAGGQGMGPLLLRGGGLACRKSGDQDRLQRLVHGEGSVLVIGTDGRQALHVRASFPALAGQGGQQQGGRQQGGLSSDHVLLMLSRPDAEVCFDAGDIAQLFGLTATEALLAASLAGGASVSEFAETRGIAEGTARLHLKRILAKTGTSRQSELVRRICLSVGGRGEQRITL